MRQILSGAIAVLGVWLAVSPWIVNNGLAWGQISAMVAGVIFLILGIVGIARKKVYFGGGDWCTLIVAIAIFIIGIAAFSADGCTRASAIVVGLVVALLAWLGVHLPKEPRNTIVVSKDGQELVEIQKMVADKHGVGGKSLLMGAMRQTVYFEPGELYVLLGQLTPAVIVAVLKEIFLSSPNISDPKKDKK